MSIKINVGSKTNLLLLIAGLIIGGSLMTFSAEQLSLLFEVDEYYFLLIGTFVLVTGIVNLLIMLPVLLIKFISRPKTPIIRERFMRDFEGEILTYSNEQALSFMRMGNFSEAIDCFNAILKMKKLDNKDVIKIKSRRARCYFKLKDYDKAYDNIREVIFHTKSETAVTDYIFRIKCELKLGKNRTARKTLKIAQKRYPGDLKLYNLERDFL